MSLDTELILDALRKHIEAVDAKWDRLLAAQDARWAKQDTVREASKGVPAPTQYAAVGDQYTAVGADDYEAPIVADNWGGLFEQPTHMLEERILDSTDKIPVESCLTSTNPNAHACVEPVPESCRTSTGVVPIQSELPAPASAATTSSAVADAAAAPAAPPEGADAGRVVPLAARVTSTAAGATEIVDSAGALSTSRPQPGAAALLQMTLPSIIVLPVSLVRYLIAELPAEPAGRLLLGHPAASPVPTRVASYFPATTARCAAKDGTASTTPTRCSKGCFSHDILVLTPISAALTYISAPVTSATSADSSLGTDQQSSKAPDNPLATSDGSMQVLRYLSNYGHAYSIGVVVPCHFTLVRCGHVVSEELSDQIAMPSLADLIDIVPWPPPVESEITNDNVQLRPAPWPSWSMYSPDVHCVLILSRVCCYSDSPSIVALLFQDVSGAYWQYWQHNLWYLMSWWIDGTKWRDSILSQFIDDLYAYLQKLGEHVSSFLGSASIPASALCPHPIKCGWLQWEIPWPYFSCLTARTQYERVNINSSNSSAVEFHLSNFSTGYILQAAVLFWLTEWMTCSENVRVHVVTIFRYKCGLPVPKVSCQRNGIQHLPFLVQQLSSITVVHHQFLWDPGGDKSWLTEFRSVLGLGDLQMQWTNLSFVKKKWWLVLFPFLSILQWQQFDLSFIKRRGWLFLLQFLSSMEFPFQVNNDDILPPNADRLIHCLKILLIAWDPGGSELYIQPTQKHPDSSRSQRCILPANSYVAIRINIVTIIKYLQVPWDPGGDSISYRLGGKPILKEGRMLGTVTLIHPVLGKWVKRFVGRIRQAQDGDCRIKLMARAREEGMNYSEQVYQLSFPLVVPVLLLHPRSSSSTSLLLCCTRIQIKSLAASSTFDSPACCPSPALYLSVSGCKHLVDIAVEVIWCCIQ
ncbi:unnamed protein product [Urochloa humidicola]